MPAGSKRPWLAAIGEGITRFRAGWGRRFHALVQLLQSVTPDRWFTLFFLLLILTFVVALLVQPSGVGRGGR